jgi:Glycosyl transferase family 2
MKLVMTLLARDEADIVDAQIAFHLNAGVDFVITTDNSSQDGTTEIFESYAHDGYLHLIREHGNDMQQGAWVTRMARLAATDFGADWVINSDADEFWCSHGAPIKTVLEGVPKRFSTVRAVMRNFVPRPGDDSFADRMNVRLVPGEAKEPRFRVHPFHPQDKVLHRAHPEVTVSEGNHDARWPSSVDLRGAWPFEVLHFPMRSAAQCETKWRNYERHEYSGYNVLTDFDPREYYESLVVDDETLAKGIAVGLFTVDNRLWDAFRRDESEPLFLPALTTQESAALAADIAAASERDAFAKAQEQVQELERRLARIEISRTPRADGVYRFVRRIGARTRS